MPSDTPSLPLALKALATPIAEFRAALAAALAQAEAVLADASANPATRTARAKVELGAFAEGHLDPEAFALRFARVPHPDSTARTTLGRAVELLRAMLARGTAQFVLDLPPGGDLGGVIGGALEQIGHAFGAIRVAEAVRSGRHEAGADPFLADTCFERWNRTERRCAPPLIVALEGADLRAAALAPFCDGRVKLLLLVRGSCAPAPLVRLITPGTFVLQTRDETGLERFAGFEGPAVAALVPASAARFLHDPAGGRESWQRLSLDELPAAPRRALGSASAWQQGEDLRQLAALARTPFSIPGSPPAAALGEAEAVERLAAWLLSDGNSPDR